jgi:hypothetical protein
MTFSPDEMQAGRPEWARNYFTGDARYGFYT